MRPRRFPWGLLLLAFIAVPILEIYVIIQVGQVIGAWWTILLLIADSIFGSWLVKHEGRRAWEALTTTIHARGESISARRSCFIGQRMDPAAWCRLLRARVHADQF